MLPHTVTVDEGERQMLLLALAICALDRPGWDYALGRLADKFAGAAMYADFKALNADRWNVRPPAPLLGHADEAEIIAAAPPSAEDGVNPSVRSTQADWDLATGPDLSVGGGRCDHCGQEKVRTSIVGDRRICDDCFYRLRDVPKR